MNVWGVPIVNAPVGLHPEQKGYNQPPRSPRELVTTQFDAPTSHVKPRQRAATLLQEEMSNVCSQHEDTQI